VSVPLTIERTAPNISVAIPDALMSVRTVSGSSGQSTCFDYRKRQWQYPQTAASTTRLRWQLPAAVLPVALDRATFTLEGNVPSRQLSIYVIRNGERIAILQQSSPGGQITIDITEADQLRLDEQGGMTIEIVVGELGSQLQQDTANATWSIRSTTLDAWGKTMPEGKENP
jgi:hypothetical protein